jgi:phospholipase/carboxylesterase
MYATVRSSSARSRYRWAAVGGGIVIALVTVFIFLQRIREPKMSSSPAATDAYLRAALQAGQASREFLQWMESASERLAPERAAGLAVEAMQVHREPLRAARAALDANPPPTELAAFAQRLREGFDDVEQAFVLFTSLTDAPLSQRIGQVLSALHRVAHAQETFYPLRQTLPPFADYWQLPGMPEPNTPVQDSPSTAGDASTPATGVFHVSAGGHHGGFSVYVPENYTPARRWPLIIALHGASGNGRDFLWIWVREAKSLGYLLVAPSSVRDTWSDIEDVGLLEIISWLSRRYQVANDRILLTGLSDGATFALLYGLAHPDTYRAVAPLSGVLHPANQALGNLGRARNMPIYMVHGALDFLFPVALARMARDTLAAAGADVVYRELPELSHTYARSENVRILHWFAALPPRHPTSQKRTVEDRPE